MGRFATIYNQVHKADAIFGTVNNEESLTQQSDRDETDINIIMERYSKTGMLPQLNMEAMTGDFSEAVDFRTAQEQILAAREAFLEVPAKLRARFHNDPQEFIDFATDPENLPELRKLGLANPEETKLQYTETRQPPTSPQEAYDDNGITTRTRDDRPPVDSAQGSRGTSREGAGAVRQREDLQPPGDRGPRSNGPSGGRG